MQGLAVPGNYWNILESGWSRKLHPNLLFFWYEEMKKDQKLIITKIADHLNYNITSSHVHKACQGASIECI